MCKLQQNLFKYSIKPRKTNSLVLGDTGKAFTVEKKKNQVQAEFLSVRGNTNILFVKIRRDFRSQTKHLSCMY